MEDAIQHVFYQLPLTIGPVAQQGTSLGEILQQLFQQLVNGVAKGSIYALVALGYTMVYGIVELINFAHGDIFMLGSFIALSIFNLMGVTGIVKGDALT